MKADFFIDRPVFSTVLSIIIVIVGAIGLALLPVDQYPSGTGKGSVRHGRHKAYPSWHRSQQGPQEENPGAQKDRRLWPAHWK